MLRKLICVMDMKRLILGVLALAFVGAVFWYSNNKNEQAAGLVPAGDPIVEINLPNKLSQVALRGKSSFETNCAACHGRNAVGQVGVAPPLVHFIYEPSHHGDESFQRAVALGVRAHHWPFGNMPPIEGLDREAVADIVAYVRELQRANGIN